MIIRQQQSTKNPANYETENKENCEFKQKPIKNFADFSDGEEEEFKKRVEKQNAARREKTEEIRAKDLKLNKKKKRPKRFLKNQTVKKRSEEDVVNSNINCSKKHFFFNVIIVKCYLD